MLMPAKLKAVCKGLVVIDTMAEQSWHYPAGTLQLNRQGCFPGSKSALSLWHNDQADTVHGCLGTAHECTELLELCALGAERLQVMRQRGTCAGQRFS